MDIWRLDCAPVGAREWNSAVLVWTAVVPMGRWPASGLRGCAARGEAEVVHCGSEPTWGGRVVVRDWWKGEGGFG